MSARGSLADGADLPVARPIAAQLPSLYAEDDLAKRFTAGLDQVLAPVLLTLDNLDAYLDPSLAPLDVVSWLAGWVGVAIDESWSAERRRTFVAGAVAEYERRGTAAGLAGVVELCCGVAPTIEEPGGIAASFEPGGGPGGTGQGPVVVRVPAEAAVDIRVVREVAAACTPAHLELVVEVSSG